MKSTDLEDWGEAASKGPLCTPLDILEFAQVTHYLALIISTGIRFCSSAGPGNAGTAEIHSTSGLLMHAVGHL